MEKNPWVSKSEKSLPNMVHDIDVWEHCIFLAKYNVKFAGKRNVYFWKIITGELCFIS